MERSHALRANVHVGHAIAFLVLTFAWTWAWWGYAIATGASGTDGVGFVAFLLGGAGPVLATLVIMTRALDAQQRRRFWRRAVTPQGLTAAWWLSIIAIGAGIWSVAVLIAVGVGLDWGAPLAAPAVGSVAGAFAFALVTGFVEEPGWRGLAHDSIRTRFSFNATVLVIGLVWALWHLPLYFLEDTFQHDHGFASGGFWLLSLALVLLSVVYGWVVERTGSILSAVLLHAITNTTYEFVAVSDHVRIIALALIAAVAFAILWWSRAHGEMGASVEAPV